jgi:hypothetical protein
MSCFESIGVIKSLALFALLSASVVQAECALSPEPHPRGEVGLQLFHADDAKAWNWAEDLGVKWIRAELRWDWLEPKDSHGQLDWTYADRVIALAHEHSQKKLLVLFNHVPLWLKKKPDLLPGRAAAALRQVATRYGNRVSSYEIFNEPNLPHFGWVDSWATPKDSAVAYSKTLAAASSAIREVDPRAFVISGGLSPANDPESYARWVIRTTPSNCYDALGVHSYGQQGRFAAIKRNANALFGQEQRPTKPLWITEHGSPTDTQHHELLTTLFSEKDVFPIVFWFCDRDLGYFTERYGLRKKDGSEKENYQTFKQLVKSSSTKDKLTAND